MRQITVGLQIACEVRAPPLVFDANVALYDSHPDGRRLVTCLCGRLDAPQAIDDEGEQQQQRRRDAERGRAQRSNAAAVQEARCVDHAGAHPDDCERQQERACHVATLEEYGDAYVGYNPPSLRGVGRRSPYLHDGRAVTLEQVFRYYHRPKKLNGKADFTNEELRDLIAFLESL